MRALVIFRFSAVGDYTPGVLPRRGFGARTVDRAERPSNWRLLLLADHAPVVRKNSIKPRDQCDGCEKISTCNVCFGSSQSLFVSNFGEQLRAISGQLPGRRDKARGEKSTRQARPMGKWLDLLTLLLPEWRTTSPSAVLNASCKRRRTPFVLGAAWAALDAATERWAVSRLGTRCSAHGELALRLRSVNAGSEPDTSPRRSRRAFVGFAT